MNLYTIEKAEVKTVFNITISAKDVREILNKLSVSALAEIYWKTESFTLSEVSAMSDVILVAKFFNLWSLSKGRNETETIGFIVREALGFDGIENFGLYSHENDCIKMSVYKNGDVINK